MPPASPGATLDVTVAVLDVLLAPPVPGLDAPHSPLDGARFGRVPVVRVFGRCASGLTTCVHVHRALPYFYVPYPGGEADGEEEGVCVVVFVCFGFERSRCRTILTTHTHALSSVKHTLLQLAHSIDAALDAADRARDAERNNGGGALAAPAHPHHRPPPRRVYDAIRVRGGDFYGYRADEGLFVRVALAAPGDVRAAAAACDSGAAWRGPRLPPYEAHIPYLLQFKADHGLVGMGTARLTRGRVRRRVAGVPPPPPRNTWWRPPDSAPDPLPDICLPPGWELPWVGAPGAGPEAPRHHGPSRSTAAPLEIDVAAADIANAADLVAVPLAALGGEASDGSHLVPSLRGVWADETARTGAPPPTPPPDGERHPQPLASAAADRLRARLERLVAEQSAAPQPSASQAAAATQAANEAPRLGLTQADVDWAAGAAADDDDASVAVVAPDDPLDRAHPPRDDDADDASAADRDPYAPPLHPDDADNDAALDALAAAAAAAGPCSQEAACAAARAATARADAAARDAADILAASQAAAVAFEPPPRRGAVRGLGGDMEDAAGGVLLAPLRGDTTLSSPAAPPDAAHEAGLYGALDVLLSQDGGLDDDARADSDGGGWVLPQGDGADGGPPPRRAPKRRAHAPPPAAPFRPPRRVADAGVPPLESAAARAALMSDGDGSDSGDGDDDAAAPPAAATAAALSPPPPACDLPPTQAPAQVEVDGEPVASPAAPSDAATQPPLSSLRGTLHPTPAAASTPPVWLRPLVPPPTPTGVAADLVGGDPGPLDARPFYSNPADAPRRPVVYGGAERWAPVGAPGGIPPWPGAPTHLGGAGGGGGGGPVWLSFLRVPPPRSVVAAWLGAEAAEATAADADTGTTAAAARSRPRAGGLAVDANSGRLTPGGGGGSRIGADALSPGDGDTQATPTPPPPPPWTVGGRGRPSRLSQAAPPAVVVESGDADTPASLPPPILRPASPRYDEGGYFHCTPPLPPPPAAVTTQASAKAPPPRAAASPRGAPPPRAPPSAPRATGITPPDRTPGGPSPPAFARGGGGGAGPAVLTVVAVEIIAASRGGRVPDPRSDAVAAILLAAADDGAPPPPGWRYPARLLCVGPPTAARADGLGAVGVGRVTAVSDEPSLFTALAAAITAADPDILVGYDAVTDSLGYLVDRGAELGIDVRAALSRAPPPRGGGGAARGAPFDAGSAPALAGRIVLDGWKLARQELKLTSYTLPAVAAAVLRVRVPDAPSPRLAAWWGGAPGTPTRWRAVDAIAKRARLTLGVLDALNVVGRTAEQVRRG